MKRRGTFNTLKNRVGSFGQQLGFEGRQGANYVKYMAKRGAKSLKNKVNRGTRNFKKRVGSFGQQLGIEGRQGANYVKYMAKRGMNKVRNITRKVY
jgi:virulence-associated protein VapD